MKAIGIILAGGNNKRMKELSYNRAIAAMPMVGTYRSIDFALSNMSNSRIQKVAVLTQYNAIRNFGAFCNGYKITAVNLLIILAVCILTDTNRTIFSNNCILCDD